MDEQSDGAPINPVAKSYGKRRPTGERKAKLEVCRQRLECRKRKIEAQLSDLNSRNNPVARKRETRANIIIGAVLRAHMSLNPSFRVELTHILHHNVHRPADRQLLANLLGMSQLESPPPNAPAESQLTRTRLAHLVADITARKAPEANGPH